MRIADKSIPIEVIAIFAIAAANCDSRLPTEKTPSATELAAARGPQPQTAGDTEQQDPEDPLDGLTCTIIDVQRLRVERVDGLYVTIRAVVDTAVDGRLYARVWLNERHTVRLGDFDLERGETFFTVLLPPPGPPVQLFVDVELEDRSSQIIQCDRSLRVEG